MSTMNQDNHPALEAQPWLVSAPHERRRADVVAAPFGPHHARKVGSPVTACGLPAAGWKYFWTLTFDPGSNKACRDCVHALRRLTPAELAATEDRPVQRRPSPPKPTRRSPSPRRRE